jgi:hypothetical protein
MKKKEGLIVGRHQKSNHRKYLCHDVGNFDKKNKLFVD